MHANSLPDERFFNEMGARFLEDTKTALYGIITNIDTLKKGYDADVTLDVINTIRSFRTSASMFGYDVLVTASHDMETLLEVYDKSNPRHATNLQRIATIADYLTTLIVNLLAGKWNAEKATTEFEAFRKVKTERAPQSAPSPAPVHIGKVLVVGMDRIYTSIIREVFDDFDTPADFVKTEADAFALFVKNKYALVLSSFYLKYVQGPSFLQALQTLRNGFKPVILTSKESVTDTNFVVLQKDKSLRASLPEWLSVTFAS